MDNNEVVTEEVAAVVENNTGIEIEPLFEEQVDFDTFSKSDFRVVKVKNCEAVPKSKKLLRFTLDDGTENERTILSGVHAFYEPEELVGKTLLAIVNLPPRSMMGIDSCGMLLSAIHNVNGEEKLNLVMLDDAIPAGAKFTVEVCNNGNDASPTWEDVTQNVVSGSKFFLSNTTKTASAWGYNFRIKVKRGTATGDCFITSAGGNFE